MDMAVAECGQDARRFTSVDLLVTHVQTVHSGELEEAKKTPAGANAPYKVQKRGPKFVVVNNTGAVKASFKTREAALSYLRALYSNVKGAPKRAAKVKFTGKAKDRADDGADDARDVKTAERKKLAAKKQALPGGSFPIKTVQDLKNAIQAYGRAKNKPQAKALIIRRARALGKTSLLPSGWLGDSAQIACPEGDCVRVFLHENLLFEHAEAVHTFDDIQRMVAEKVRDSYAKPGNYKASPPVGATWAWVQDLADDWVVFMVEKDNDSTLYKASYSITDNDVTLGTVTEVVRRTVYETVKKD